MTIISGSDTVISWVRRRDLHIITIASITYTADRRWQTSQVFMNVWWLPCFRFSCTHLEDQDVWRLSIKAATLADSGDPCLYFVNLRIQDSLGNKTKYCPFYFIDIWCKSDKKCRLQTDKSDKLKNLSQSESFNILKCSKLLFQANTNVRWALNQKSANFLDSMLQVGLEIKFTIS